MAKLQKNLKTPKKIGENSKRFDSNWYLKPYKSPKSQNFGLFVIFFWTFRVWKVKTPR